MRVTATAVERPVQAQAFVAFRRVEQAAAGEAGMLGAHRAAQLEDQEPFDSLVDSVIVWLRDAYAPVIADLDQMLVLDGESQTVVERMGAASHVDTSYYE